MRKFLAPAGFEAVEKVKELAVCDLNFNQRVEFEFENNSVGLRDGKFFAEAQKNIAAFAFAFGAAAGAVRRFLAFAGVFHDGINQRQERFLEFFKQRQKSVVVVFAEPLHVAAVEAVNFAGSFIFHFNIGKIAAVKAGVAHVHFVYRRGVRIRQINLLHNHAAGKEFDEKFSGANFFRRVRENVF